MTLAQFYEEVAKMNKDYPTWRVGQNLFNTLVYLRPDIAKTIRNTPNDPFFSDSIHDPRYMAAVKVIEMMWEDQDG